VAHVCNPSYSGCRDQEDCCSNQLREIVHGNLSKKKKHFTKKIKVGRVPGVQTPSTTHKKKKKKSKK
jgi:hypothetical protein